MPVRRTTGWCCWSRGAIRCRRLRSQSTRRPSATWRRSGSVCANCFSRERNPLPLGDPAPALRTIRYPRECGRYAVRQTDLVSCVMPRPISIWGHPDVAKLYAANDQLLRGYNDFLLQIAVAHETSRRSGRTGRTGSGCNLLLTRHLLDQGFGGGECPRARSHHLGYSMRNFYTAPVLMRDVLRRAGPGVTTCSRPWSGSRGVGEVKTPSRNAGHGYRRLQYVADRPSGEHRDAARHTAEGGLSGRPSRAGSTTATRLPEGTSPCFKSDGTVFHHRHHYPAYAVDGFSGGAVNAVWLLSKTRFAVSRESHEILKRALLEMRFYCNLRSFPLALSGRHPDGKGALVPWHYARLAVAGSPDGREPIDSDLAAAYLRLNPARTPTPVFSWSRGFTAEPSPEGTHVYGYNVSLSHPAVVTGSSRWAGHSRYLWAAENLPGGQPLRALPDVRKPAAVGRRRSGECLRQRLPPGGVGLVPHPRNDGPRDSDGADEGRYPQRRHLLGLRGDAPVGRGRLSAA